MLMLTLFFGVDVEFGLALDVDVDFGVDVDVDVVDDVVDVLR